MSRGRHSTANRLPSSMTTMRLTNDFLQMKKVSGMKSDKIILKNKIINNNFCENFLEGKDKYLYLGYT